MIPQYDDAIETERLVLRRMTGEDAAFVLALLNTPKFIRFIGDRGVRTLDEAGRYIDERFIASYRQNGYGLLAVARRSDGVPVGACGLVRRPALSGPDLGFAFLPEFERKGYGHESAAAVMEWARRRGIATRVLAIATPDNDASTKLLEKLGFRLDGQIEIDGDNLNLFSCEL